MIYLVYQNGVLLYPTTMPRVVIDAFKSGADRVELWHNEKPVKAVKSLAEFMRIINPPANDDEIGGAEYEW